MSLPEKLREDQIKEIADTIQFAISFCVMYVTSGSHKKLYNYTALRAVNIIPLHKEEDMKQQIMF
jgi:hypothetical protein